MTHQLLLQLPPTVMHQCGQRQKGEAEDTCRIGGKFVGSPSSWRFCDRESAGENGSSAARRASSPAVISSARVQRAFLCPGTGVIIISLTWQAAKEQRCSKPALFRIDILGSDRRQILGNLFVGHLRTVILVTNVGAEISAVRFDN